MTIIVMGELHTAKGGIDGLVPALSAMAARTNEEAGCEHYSFARHIDDADTVIISERWASEEALAAHGTSAHMGEFRTALGSSGAIESLVVKAWNGTFWRNLIGE